MKKRVLIIGGYGNFGSFISRSLVKENNVQLIIAGRSKAKAKLLIAELDSKNTPEVFVLDIAKDILENLKKINPDIVIHTSGPFQAQSYEVADAAIAVGANYIDLADGRDFVDKITSLDQAATNNNVLVVSGASSVPCLTAALVDHYAKQFQSIDSLDYGITTAQKTARGLATTAAILGYTGKPFKTLVAGENVDVYGWQSLRIRKYRKLGYRLLGNCDVPDLALFPKRYPTLKSIRFYAGLELPFIHVTLWVFSWLVRWNFIKRLEKLAPLLLRISFWFDWLGSSKSAFHMQLSGIANDGQQKEITFELTAESGDGPYIPCMPAILLAKKMINGECQKSGAFPCVDFIDRDEYLSALGELDISWQEYWS